MNDYLNIGYELFPGIRRGIVFVKLKVGIK